MLNVIATQKASQLWNICTINIEINTRLRQWCFINCNSVLFSRCCIFLPCWPLCRKPNLSSSKRHQLRHSCEGEIRRLNASFYPLRKPGDHFKRLKITFGIRGIRQRRMVVSTAAAPHCHFPNPLMFENGVG